MIFHIYLCGSTASQAGPKHERSCCVYRQRHNLHVECVRGSEGCLYYTVLCCCVYWAICRAHRLFRIEVKCESALKPAVKSNKFAIVHSAEAINQQQLGVPLYIYISNNWPMADDDAVAVQCSVRWPFIMWNANKMPSRADWVVIWPAVSQIANHYRCLLSPVPSLQSRPRSATLFHFDFLAGDNNLECKEFHNELPLSEQLPARPGVHVVVVVVVVVAEQGLVLGLRVLLVFR